MDPATVAEALQAMTTVAAQVANAVHALSTSGGATHHVVNVARDQQPQGFHGKSSDDAEEWLEKFQSCAVINNWPEDSLVARAKPMLKEAAWRWYKEVIADTPVSWVQFCELMLQRFRLSTTQAVQKLHLRFQTKKETLHEFADAMKQLFRQVGIPEGMQILQFAQKLRPELSQKVMHRQCATLEQAILSAAQYEANERYAKQENENWTRLGLQPASKSQDSTATRLK